MNNRLAQSTSEDFRLEDQQVLDAESLSAGSQEQPADTVPESPQDVSGAATFAVNIVWLLVILAALGIFGWWQVRRERPKQGASSKKRA